MATFGGHFKRDGDGNIVKYESVVQQGCCTSPDTQDNYFSGNLTNNPVNTYYYNNFNNIYYSYVTLFELMVVNNWFVIMDGHVASHGNRRNLDEINVGCTKSLKDEFDTVSLWWLPKFNSTPGCNGPECYAGTNYSLDDEYIRLYFLIFYVVVVILVSNVVVAFILEAFMTRMAAEDDGLVSADLDFEEATVGLHKIIDSRYNNYSAPRKMHRLDNIGEGDASELVYYIGYRVRTLEDMRMLMYKEDLPRWNREAAIATGSYRQKDSLQRGKGKESPSTSPSTSEQDDTGTARVSEFTAVETAFNTPIEDREGIPDSLRYLVKRMEVERLQKLSKYIEQALRDRANSKSRRIKKKRIKESAVSRDLTFSDEDSSGRISDLDGHV